MRFPPRLSSGQMWWVGLGVLLLSLVLNYVLNTQLSRLYDSVGAVTLASSIFPYVSGLVQILQLVGAGMVAASFVVRRLETREVGGTTFGDEVPENWTDGRR
ncbi:hypothetical protein [Georgenia subflava]|uniref:Uncharacterized protein n=1 Tax=Georgenia subflava TaxID=1622177 RepID=A0A6N7ESC0_9MICO|nr:hypothetical protein [Georgenia subflava]MPV39006.1 hypothetical protein [Georgenia subflava]